MIIYFGRNSPPKYLLFANGVVTCVVWYDSKFASGSDSSSNGGLVAGSESGFWLQIEFKILFGVCFLEMLGDSFKSNEEKR